MKHVNFRLTDAEYHRVDLVARNLEATVPALLKDLGLKGNTNVGIEIAMNLYKGGKIGLKRAWMLSSLEFHEFLALLQESDIEPVIPDSLVDKMIEMWMRCCWASQRLTCRSSSNPTTAEALAIP